MEVKKTELEQGSVLDQLWNGSAARGMEIKKTELDQEAF